MDMVLQLGPFLIPTCFRELQYKVKATVDLKKVTDFND